MIIFDTETTGLVKNGLVPLKDQPQIIEFAAIKLDDKTLEEVGRIEFLANPKCKLPAIITKITGIKDSDLIGKPEFVESLPALRDFFLGEKYSFAHNHNFDTQMLSLELRRLKKQYAFPWPMNPICTVNKTMGIKGFRLKLSQLYFHLFQEEFPDAHRAMADVEALTRVVRELIKTGIIKL